MGTLSECEEEWETKEETVQKRAPYMQAEGKVAHGGMCQVQPRWIQGNEADGTGGETYLLEIYKERLERIV